MKKSIIKQVSFPCEKSGTELRGRFIIPNVDGQKKIPIVIMLTGDGPKGTKSLSWVNIPPKLIEKGIATFLFDFQGLGYSEGNRKNLTITVGINNLISTFKFLKKQNWVDTEKIGILASSFGANVLLLSPLIANQCSVIGFKSPSCFLPDAYVNEIGKESLENWFKYGFNKDNGYNINVLVDNFKYNTYNEASLIKPPTMIIHGVDDEIIPISQSIYLYNILNCEKELVKLEGVSHSYKENNAWEIMANLLIDWYTKKLKK